MKISCDLVKDLIPLYQDEVCSLDSKNIVEEHINKCEDCRRYFVSLSKNIGIETVDVEKNLENISVKKCFRKIKKRFLSILLSVVIALPVLVLLFILSVNEIRREGVCFSNMDDLYRANRYMKYMVTGDYHNAFLQTDQKGNHESISNVKDIDENDPSTPSEEIERKAFVYQNFGDEVDMTYPEFLDSYSKRCAKAYEESGIVLTSYQFIDTYYTGENICVVEYKVLFQLQNGESETYLWELYMGKNGIQCSGYEPLIDAMYQRLLQK